MRIAIVHWAARRVAGAESYLSVLIPGLAARGHELAMMVEMDLDSDHEPIPLPAGSPMWSVGALGLGVAIQQLRDWAPDVVLNQITLDPSVEAAAQSVAPAVFFPHAYYGTCISGAKMTRLPYPTPCDRAFGPACLLHFYPRRCGGLNPVTMIQDYRRQTSRLRLLSGYRYILTNSSHMREEYARNGADPRRLVTVRMPVDTIEVAPQAGGPSGFDHTLLFVGRMDSLKGGRVAIDALPEIQGRLGGSLRLVMLGDGPERPSWAQHARRVQTLNPGLRVEFTGWTDQTETRRWMGRSDLLLVPSLWPEPFGLVGPEAGTMGLPAVAFDVGGISEWLTDGVNGHFARGERNDAPALAAAAWRALEDADHHLALRDGARRLAARHTIQAHIEEVEKYLVAAAGAERPASIAHESRSA